MAKPWTSAEDAIVRSNNIAGAVSLLSHRTWSAVRSRRPVLECVRTRKWSGPRKLWTKTEDRRLWRYREEALLKLAKRFKRHSIQAVKARRSLLYGYWRPLQNDWTKLSERRLRELWPSASKADLLDAIPGHSWSALAHRAHKLGIRRIAKLKASLNGLKEEVRKRAREDGVPLGRLGVEIGHPSYFKNIEHKGVDLNKIAKAVEFFGGRLVIDWQDE